MNIGQGRLLVAGVREREVSYPPVAHTPGNTRKWEGKGEGTKGKINTHTGKINIEANDR